MMLRRKPEPALTPDQQAWVTRLYFDGMGLIEIAANTGLHPERIRAFYESWKKTEARDESS